MMTQKEYSEAQLQNTMGLYEKFYADQVIYLTLWKGKKCIYPVGEDEILTIKETEVKNEIKICEEEGIKTIQVQGVLCEDENSYYLRYEKELKELSIIWKQLERKYLLISLAFSVLLAILLYLILRKVMNPVSELKRVVDEMADGKLETRIQIRGKDEIASLGEHFNKMAEKMQDNILHIQKEAELKQNFVDNFAHELKSPLTSIYGFAEYIQKAKVPEEEIIQSMEYIMEESKRMLQLSYTLLDMAKMRKEKLPMEKLSVKSLFEKVGKRVEPICQATGVLLEFEVMVEDLYGNEILLQSLLYNLLHNGIFACKEGGRIVMRSKQDKGRLHLSVEDNGCGMEEEELEKVVEPFYRIDKARGREEGRTGLGLALCRQIAEYHHAELAVESEMGVGTKVSVIFSEIFTD